MKKKWNALFLHKGSPFFLLVRVRVFDKDPLVSAPHATNVWALIFWAELSLAMFKAKVVNLSWTTESCKCWGINLLGVADSGRLLMKMDDRVDGFWKSCPALAHLSIVIIENCVTSDIF